ncbi:MAG: RNA 2',3'-cyclic phosphodiesterase [Phycisphaeraceae bacterium]|nr:RNA 2',3'-cyclic phosphodiesterase [Phycisphaeraceae bacterium]
MRLFCAVELHPTPIIRNLIERFSAHGGLFKTVKPDPLHLTLRFHGEVDTERVDVLADQLDQVAAGHRWFNLQMRGLGTFPASVGLAKWPRVIFVAAVTPSPIERIAAALAEPGDRPFVAHLTLARHRPKRRPHRVQRQKLTQLLSEHRQTDFGLFPARELCLIESVLTSDGPIYTVRHRAALQR